MQLNSYFHMTLTSTIIQTNSQHLENNYTTAWDNTVYENYE